MASAQQTANQALEIAQGTQALIEKMLASQPGQPPQAPPSLPVQNSSPRFNGDTVFQDGQILWVPIAMGNEHKSSTGKSMVLGTANGRLGQIRFSASAYRVIK